MFNTECDFFILSLLDIKKDEKQAAIVQLAQTKYHEILRS